MAVERILRFDVGDLKGLSFECRKCRAVSTFELANVMALESCPMCRERWVAPDTTPRQATGSLVNGLRYLAQQDGDLSFALRFEVPAS